MKVIFQKRTWLLCEKLWLTNLKYFSRTHSQHSWTYQMIKITFLDISLCVHLLRRLMFTCVRKNCFPVSSTFPFILFPAVPRRVAELFGFFFLIQTHDFHIFKQLFVHCRTLPEPACSYAPVHTTFWVVTTHRGVRACLFYWEDLCSILWGFEVFCAAPCSFSPAFLQSLH